MESKIFVDDQRGQPGETIQIKTKITDVNEKTNLSGKIVFKLNDVTVESRKFNGGNVVFDYTIPSNFSCKDYEIKIIYGGNSEYDPEDIVRILTVRKPVIETTVQKTQESAVRTIQWINVNKMLPASVLVEDKELSITNYLDLLLSTITSINEAKTDVSAFGYNSPEFFSEEIKEGELSKKEYLELVDKLRDDMFRDEKGPAFIETSLGKLGYMSIIYNMALIVANSSSNSLLSAINVVPWVNITNP